MYHVLSTGIIILSLYLIFLLFRKTGILSPNDNRRIWNLILGITFCITAIAGIILAVRINYRFNNTFFDQLLKWHVETGIAFTFTGFIHLIVHFQYFREILSSKKEVHTPEIPATGQVGSGSPGSNLFFIGFTSTSVQLLLMREMINISGGYELIAGTYLAAWLINSAAGAFFAGRTRMFSIRELNILMAVSPLISVFLMVVSGRVFLHPGETPGFLDSMLFTIIVLLPVCFVSGFTFIKLLETAAADKTYSSGRSFSIETVGGIAAGLMVTVLTAGILDTYQALFMVLLLFAVFLSVSFIPSGNRSKPLLIFACILISLMVLWFSPSLYIRQLLLPAIEVTGTTDSPYGNITAGSYRGENFIYYNHRLARWSYDEIEREESVHYALLQHRDPRRILIISGDPFSAYSELIKYQPETIVFIERDPELVKLARKEMEDKENFRIEADDAFRYISRQKETFDVIIMNLAPPSSLQLSRYYSEEFFRHVHSSLHPGGIFVCSPGPFENYFNEQSASLYSIIYNTLASVFSNITPISGYKLYLVASDGNTRTDICSLYRERDISNVYVNCDYLDDELITMKSEELRGLLSRKAKINTLSDPAASFFFQAYNLTMQPGKILPALFLLVIFFVLPVAGIPARNFPMYAAAGALAGFEITALVFIQTVMGNIYHLTGLVIACVMAGLAAGAASGFPRTEKKSLRPVLLLMSAFYLGMFFLADPVLSVKPGITYIALILLLSFFPSYLTGVIFRILSEGEEGKKPTASGVYSSDLAGSALGFITISAVALPLAGIEITLIIFAVITLTAFIFAVARRK